jgi:hypothetical protein
MHARGEVTSEEYGDNDVCIIGRAPADLVARINLFVQGKY